METPAEVREVEAIRENGFLPLRPAQGLFFSETFREGGNYHVQEY